MIRPTTSRIITTRHGVPVNGSRYGKHLGTDYSLPLNSVVVAPVSGKIATQGWSDAVGNYIEIDGDDGRRHRLLHLNERNVSTGIRVAEGQRVGLSGDTGSTSTGPHLHWDARRAGTGFNDGFENFVDTEALVSVDMPPVGSRIKLKPKQVRTTFRVGTANQVGKINVTDDTFVYIVRGYDNAYPGRIIINSASGGGNGVGLALYYLSGKRIDGWQKV